MKHLALLLLLALAPWTFTSSTSAVDVRPGDTFTITLIATAVEDVYMIQYIDQARFEVVAVEPPDPRLHLGQLGHVPLVSYSGPGPITQTITLRVLPNAPGGNVTLLAQAHTADKIPVQSSVVVNIPYRVYVP